MKKIFPLACVAVVVFGLSGCASTGPIPLGEGRYMISDTNGFYNKGGEVLKDVLAEARVFCAKQGKDAVALDVRLINASYSMDAGADLTFECR